MRQQNYAATLNVDGVYTPQMTVDDRQLVGSKKRRRPQRTRPSELRQISHLLAKLPGVNEAIHLLAFCPTLVSEEVWTFQNRYRLTDPCTGFECNGVVASTIRFAGTAGHGYSVKSDEKRSPRDCSALDDYGLSDVGLSQFLHGKANQSKERVRHCPRCFRRPDSRKASKDHRRNPDAGSRWWFT